MFKFVLNTIKKNLFSEILNIDGIDSPETNKKNKKIIQENYLLRRFYVDCYKLFKKELVKENKFNSKILEIGSGAGFIKEFIPKVITSEIIDLDGIDLKINATTLPFPDNYLDAIILLNVIHHISNPKNFLNECERVLKKNGIILMIEPAKTWFSKIIYKNFHHEAFDEFADWYLKKGGRLSEANQAIPYIIFERDKNKFKKLFPNLKITKIFKFKPLHYILSGGFSYKPFFNGKLILFIIKIIEFLFKPISRFIGLFMYIKIKKN